MARRSTGQAVAIVPVTPRARPICGTCAAWSEANGTNFGYCRRHPPHPSGWAKLQATEWCLDHVPRTAGD